MTRVLTVDTRRELEQEMSQHVNEHGYKVKNDEGDTAWLVESGMGSIWWHLLFLFLTAGFGNIAYAIYTRLTADAVVIEVE
jgi:hypothetical protein